MKYSQTATYIKAELTQVYGAYYQLTINEDVTRIMNVLDKNLEAGRITEITKELVDALVFRICDEKVSY